MIPLFIPSWESCLFPNLSLLGRHCLTLTKIYTFNNRPSAPPAALQQPVGPSQWRKERFTGTLWIAGAGHQQQLAAGARARVHPGPSRSGYSVNK
ncbi:MAG: hypothetical protein KME26_20400 [Oscillatoria princeps RMCB-10]|nr:hypothetical protein [Oscillatoria princeps RMCB-10]